jgi:RNA polymerase sigma factor (sigma-70 family)
MPTEQLRHVLLTLRGAAVPVEAAALSDGQLLEQYLQSREEDAFAALVQRHGPMVWGVCRRVVASYQDAEDAFQATFLVLVRKAAAIVPRDMVANWLYGVAHQTARNARAIAARRRAREKQMAVMPEPADTPSEIRDDWQPLLDLELGRLPEKYRAVIVLCDLEGKTRKEAARHCRVPEGTVASRLATARSMLARRLARHGVPVGAAALTASAVPASLASSTIKAATLFAAGRAAGVLSPSVALLAEGVLKTMLLTKLKIATAVLLTLAVVGVGTVALTQQTPAGSAKTERKPPPQKPVRADEPVAPQNVVTPPSAPPVKKTDAEPVPTQVSGIVKAVDAPNATLTVSHGGAETTFRVTPDADIQIDGKRGPLAALPAGASVHLRRFVDARTTRSVLAEGRWLWGTVKAVDVVGSTITYGERAQDGGAGRMFNVPTDLVISIDGKAGNLAGIPAGACANLQLFADQTTVRNLSVEGAQVNGIAKTVDAAGRTITVNDTTYRVAPGAHVSIDHAPGKLEDVPAGANTILNLQVDQKTVLRISAAGNSDFGTVKAVDAAGGTITVTGGPPEDRVYIVPANAPISIDGKAGALAAIPVGAGLHALNLRADQKTVLNINVVGPSLHHVGVKAVDPVARTITLDDKAPNGFAGKTLVVAADANLQLDGKPAKLDAIPVGAFVNLGLSVDSQTARNVQAEGPSLGGCGGSCISAVDAAANTITFANDGPAEVAGKTFRVMPDVWVQIDAKPGKLADIPAGSYVNVTLTADQQLVRSVWAVGPPVPGVGVVRAVDLAQRTITVDDRTYPVEPNANIVIDNRGGLAALQPGMHVALRLCVDQKTLGTIAVQAK